MSKLNVDQKTIKDLFQDKRADFLIPDYQRPYAWGETECQTLWDDIFSFAIPDEGRIDFDSNSEYFLGPIVTYKNERRILVPTDSTICCFSIIGIFDWERKIRYCKRSYGILNTEMG